MPTPDVDYIIIDKEHFAYFWALLEPMLGDKVDKVSGKGLSTNDFTDALRDKLVAMNSGLSESEVRAIVAEVVDSAPAALDTLKELAAALGNDASFSTTVTTALGNKVDQSDIRVITNAEIDTIMGVSAIGSA